MLHLSSLLQDISLYLLPCVASTAATEGEREQSKQQGSPLAVFACYSTWRLLVLLGNVLAHMQLRLPLVCGWIHRAAGACDRYMVQLLGDKCHVMMLVW